MVLLINRPPNSPSDMTLKWPVHATRNPLCHEIAVRILLISNRILRFQIKKMTILVSVVSLGCLNIINHVTTEYLSRNEKTTVAILGVSVTN